ncbi:uncharacterized protein LOC126571304 isoform X3 [Anopheles aquasalis]|uniref:uncharacterized protein LOC126571304 isoform X3 n=1 Tax=Anopheles aquasalis TaxID=42839 RepID=UPI00215A7378|nr:uncharacterized protein LOC126571304 isoform X3 [Anopheles aquasalis]
MVIGEQVEGGEAMPPSPQQYPPQKATIENIMSGIENTGAVKMNNHRKKLRQRFDIIKKLGQGTYGKVQLGINKETGQEVAIKTIKKSKIETEADLIRIRREVQIMSSVQHPNIIHIYEVFENREKMVLVMEFAAGGELYDYLSERKVLAEEEARRIFRQVSTAIYYCHKHKICHRDLKLENILLDENGNAKIADFGLSNVFDEQRLLATFCGSPLYASPEIVKGTPYQGPEVDCWSLGVLLYTLVYGAMPFDGANFKRLVKQISAGDYFEPKKPSRASPLIREMLTVCPRQRASIEQICNHWWVNEGYDESCLDLAEELANQTPVRLDVLLSLAPPSVTADQLLVGNGQEEAAKSKDRIQRSHSVGSIVDMGGTEAERRILDMVAAGGEAALMPSPTRTITPAEATSSPAQTKRKLETTVSTENATGAVKKKDKADPSPSHPRIPEVMDTEESVAAAEMLEPAPQPTQESVAATESTPVSAKEHAPPSDKFEAQEVLEDLQNLENMCDELLLEAATQPHPSVDKPDQQQLATASEAPVATNGTAQPAVASDVPHKSVASVRAMLEKLEKPESEPKPVTVPPTVRKVFGKNKTTDLTMAINEANARSIGGGEQHHAPGGGAHRSASSGVERKNSLPEESLARTAERRKSRILETAEKFQSMNQQQPGGNEKFKKFVLPGGGVPTVGNYKKEFERKTGLSNSATFTKPSQPAGTLELQQQRKLQEAAEMQEAAGASPAVTPVSSGPAKSISSAFQPLQPMHDEPSPVKSRSDDEVKESDSKSSVSSFSLEEARRSMENSIALLNKAKPSDTSAPTTPTIEQLCTRTESFSMLDEGERERKLKNAREIIGNAIPIGRLRKPPMPFGANGRSTTGTLGINKPYRFGSETPEPRCENMSIPRKVSIGSIPTPPKDETKTSHAEITLKSATLPRRKLSNKPLELQAEGQPKAEQRTQQQSSAFTPMRFSTEFQHQIPDLRSAPIGRDLPPAFAPMSSQHQRANSLEPQGREGGSSIPYAGQQKPPAYGRPSFGQPGQPVRGTLSRQSTNESNDSDTTISQGPMSTAQTSASGLMSSMASQSGASSTATMPIKKSPREFIIPIAVEGGGIVTPRANSLEPSESNTSTASAAAGGVAGFGMKPRLGRPRRLGSLLTENEAEGMEPPTFQRLNRHTSLGRDSDSEEPKFHMMHRLRSSRPSKRGKADPNDSASSGEEDDDDGFEILTAENLFSTLLSRVRALTNRLNVNDVSSPRFPASRFMNNLRQAQPPFWHQDPFSRHMTDGNAAGNAWRHSMSRDLSTDIDSMFSRSGATLPRGTRVKSQNNNVMTSNNNSNSNPNHHHYHHYHHHHHHDPPSPPPPPPPPNTSGSSIRSSVNNNRYSYHQNSSNIPPTPSSFYKELASLAAGTGVLKGGDGASSRERDRSSTEADPGGPAGAAAPSLLLSPSIEDDDNDDDDSVASVGMVVGSGYGGHTGPTTNGQHHEHDHDHGLAEDDRPEENLDLRDLDLSQLRLSKRDLETLSSITPSLSQRVQEQLLAQLPPQQARKLSRTLSMQNGTGNGTTAGTTPSSQRQLYRRSYSNSAGSRSIDSTDYYTGSASGRSRSGTAAAGDGANLANGGSGVGGGDGSSWSTLDYRRRAGSQPRDILSPPPGYQTGSLASASRVSGNTGPSLLYEKYAPYGSGHQSSLYNDLSSSGTSRGSGYPSFDYHHHHNSSSSSSSNNTTATLQQHSSTTATPTSHHHNRYSPIAQTAPDTPGNRTLLAGHAQHGTEDTLQAINGKPPRRLSRFLRPDFFDPPKDDTRIESESSSAAAPLLPPVENGSGGARVTLREGGGRQRRLEKLGNESITDRLSYFLEKYKKPDQSDSTMEQPTARRQASEPLLVRDGTERSSSSGAGSEKPLSAAETLSLLQEQLEDLTNLTTLVANGQLHRRIGDGHTAETEQTCVREEPTGCPDCPSSSNPESSSTVAVGNVDPPGETVSQQASVPATGTTGTKKVVKVKKVKVVKAKSATTTTGATPASTGETSTTVVAKLPEDATTVSATVVIKKPKKVDPPTDGTKDAVVNVKKESKLLRPKSYPYKDAGQDAKLSVPALVPSPVDDPPVTASAKSNGEPSVAGETGAVEETPGATNSSLSGGTTGGMLSKIARPKSFPSSKLTPPKELKLVKGPSPAKEPPTDVAPVEAKQKSPAPADPAVPAAGAPKKVKKVIRIVKKVAKASDGTSKVLSTTTTTTTTTAAADDDASKVVKEERKNAKEQGGTKTVAELDDTSSAATASQAETKKTAATKEKSPEKKLKQGFLASIGQRFEKFRDTSRSNREKKAAAAAAASAAEEVLPDTAVPVMQPPGAVKKEKKKTKQEVANGGGATTVPTTEGASEETGKQQQATTNSNTTSGRRSRIDSVIRNLRELSTTPKVGTELTESKLIKRAVSVEEMPGTFNRCGVTKVLGLFKKMQDKDSARANNRLLNTKSSSHIAMGTAAAGGAGGGNRAALEPLPDLMPLIDRRVNRSRQQEPSSKQHDRTSSTGPVRKVYGGARSDTVLQHGSQQQQQQQPDRAIDDVDLERKLRGPSATSQIPVKYGCPGCAEQAEGQDRRSNRCCAVAEPTAETGSNLATPPCPTYPEEPERRGTTAPGGASRPNARALTIDLEQAVHSATEKLKRLQQATNQHHHSLHHHHHHHHHHHTTPSQPSPHNLQQHYPGNHSQQQQQQQQPQYLVHPVATKASVTNDDSVHNALNNNNSTHSSSSSTNNNNYSYPPPLPCEVTMGTMAVVPSVATVGGGASFNSMLNSSNNNNNLHCHTSQQQYGSTLTPSSYDSITNYSSGSRSSPYDDNSSSTFLSPSEERELYFDSWSVCSDEQQDRGHRTTLHSPSPASSSGVVSSVSSRRHSTRLTQPSALPSVSPVDPDTESVIERIRRKSFYTRFNEKKPAKRSSATNLSSATSGSSSSTSTLIPAVNSSATSASSSALHGLGKEVGGSYGSGSYYTTRDKSLTRGGSTSYLLRPKESSSSSPYGGGKYDGGSLASGGRFGITGGGGIGSYATIGGRSDHHRYATTMLNLSKPTSNHRQPPPAGDRVRAGSTAGSDYSLLLQNNNHNNNNNNNSHHHQHLHNAHQHHYHHHHHHLPRTGSRLLATNGDDGGDADDDDVAGPISGANRYTSSTNNNNSNSLNNNNNSHKYTRNTYYETSPTMIVGGVGSATSYSTSGGRAGTYSPKHRRSSFVAPGSYHHHHHQSTINDITSSSSSSIALDLLKDHHHHHHRVASDGGGAAASGTNAIASSSSSNTLSASENNYGGSGSGGATSSNSTPAASGSGSRTLRSYETRSSSLLTPAALREARFGSPVTRYDSGTLTKSYRNRTSSTSRPTTDNSS